MHIFHKWGKWETYELTKYSSFYGIPTVSSNLWQRRSCEICGFTQNEYINCNDSRADPELLKAAFANIKPSKPKAVES